jgi:hypothetical protein
VINLRGTVTTPPGRRGSILVFVVGVTGIIGIRIDFVIEQFQPDRVKRPDEIFRFAIVAVYDVVFLAITVNNDVATTDGALFHEDIFFVIVRVNHCSAPSEDSIEVSFPILPLRTEFRPAIRAGGLGMIGL